MAWRSDVGVCRYDDETAEIRRMYVAPPNRTRGIGRAFLDALLTAARELSYTRVRLETGNRQPEAPRALPECGLRADPVPGPIRDGRAQYLPRDRGLMRENSLQIELLNRDLREDTWEAALQRRERLAQAGTWLGSSRQDCRSSRKTRSERLQIGARIP